MSWLRALWARLVGLFRRKPVMVTPRLGSIPAPQTLVARIEEVEDLERQAIRLAQEAVRRGYPEQGVVAYWKAARHFLALEQHQKALGMLQAILQLKPDEIEAHVARADANLGLGRKKDALQALLAAAQLAEERGEWPRGRQLRERAATLGAIPTRDIEANAAAAEEPALEPPVEPEVAAAPPHDDGAPIELVFDPTHGMPAVRAPVAGSPQVEARATTSRGVAPSPQPDLRPPRGASSAADPAPSARPKTLTPRGASAAAAELVPDPRPKTLTPRGASAAAAELAPDPRPKTLTPRGAAGAAELAPDPRPKTLTPRGAAGAAAPRPKTLTPHPSLAQGSGSPAPHDAADDLLAPGSVGQAHPASLAAGRRGLPAPSVPPPAASGPRSSGARTVELPDEEEPLVYPDDPITGSDLLGSAGLPPDPAEDRTRAMPALTAESAPELAASGDGDEFDIPLEAKPRPAPIRPRFAIPAQSTVYEPGLPSAIRGTEHEQEASDDLAAPSASPIQDGATTALDSREIQELLAKKRGLR